VQLTCHGVAADTSRYTIPIAITNFQELEEVTAIHEPIGNSSREELITSTFTIREGLKEVITRCLSGRHNQHPGPKTIHTNSAC
jgi:hypothetical protein